MVVVVVGETAAMTCAHVTLGDMFKSTCAVGHAKRSTHTVTRESLWGGLDRKTRKQTG